jgi:hypothetical protein
MRLWLNDLQREMVLERLNSAMQRVMQDAHPVLFTKLKSK